LDWYYEQTLNEESSANLASSTDNIALYGYGFNFAKTGVFKDLMAEYGQLLDVPDPDTKTLSERRLEREKLEDTDFNEDHYLSDL